MQWHSRRTTTWHMQMPSHCPATTTTPPLPSLSLPLYTQLISSKCGGAVQWQQLQIMTNTASGKDLGAGQEIVVGKNFKIRIKNMTATESFTNIAHTLFLALCLFLSLSLFLSLFLTRTLPLRKPALIRLWFLIKCSKRLGAPLKNFSIKAG